MAKRKNISLWNPLHLRWNVVLVILIIGLITQCIQLDTAEGYTPPYPLTSDQFSADFYGIDSYKTDSKGAGAFSSPLNIAMDPSTANAYIIDRFNDRIQVYNAQSHDFTLLEPTFPESLAQFKTYLAPDDLAISPDGNHLYIFHNNYFNYEVKQDIPFQYYLITHFVKSSNQWVFSDTIDPLEGLTQDAKLTEYVAQIRKDYNTNYLGTSLYLATKISISASNSSIYAGISYSHNLFTNPESETEHVISSGNFVKQWDHTGVLQNTIGRYRFPWKEAEAEKEILVPDTVTDYKLGYISVIDVTPSNQVYVAHAQVETATSEDSTDSTSKILVYLYRFSETLVWDSFQFKFPDLTSQIDGDEVYTDLRGLYIYENGPNLEIYASRASQNYLALFKVDSLNPTEETTVKHTLGRYGNEVGEFDQCAGLDGKIDTEFNTFLLVADSKNNRIHAITVFRDKIDGFK